MTEGHVVWEMFSDYAYVILTVIGVFIVMGLAYARYRKADGYYNREKRK